MKKPKKLTYAKAKKKCDEWYSKYRRLKEADSYGNVVCVTCGKRGNWKGFQCGHYISRNCLALRWEDRNTDVQEVGCNVYGNGKIPEFAIHLRKKWGLDILEKLDFLSKIQVKYSAQDLMDKAEYFKGQAEQIAREKGIEI